jgi:hypothetical protein
MSDTDTIQPRDVKDELGCLSKRAARYGYPDEGINFEEMERELLKKAMVKSNMSPQSGRTARHEL